MNNYLEFAKDLSRRSGSKFDLALALELLKIARQMHKIDVDFCNVNFTEKQRARRERRLTLLLERAYNLARELGGLTIYHQSDPRGWSLHIIFAGDIPEGERLDSYYDRGLAIPPGRS